MTGIKLLHISVPECRTSPTC